MATAVETAPIQVTPAPLATGEQRFALSGVDWPSYVKIADGIGERHVRVTYDRGDIELMTTSYLHEWWSDRLHTVIKALAMELNIDLQSGGPTTIRREFEARGLEPDQCYFIASAHLVAGPRDFVLEDVPAPDLAVEVDISRSSLNRMGIYAAIGVPEVWRCDGASLRVYHLGPGRNYQERAASLSFPGVPLENLARFLFGNQGLIDTALMRAVHNWAAAGFNWTSSPDTP